MRIVTYRDLKSKDGLMPLLDHAFRWVFNQTESERLIKIDPRMKDGPVGFCALEDATIIGHVGVMDIPTRTVNGDIQHVGGIYGVATLPGYTCQGVSTTLMNTAHHYFIEEGHDFSFLVTSPSLIAHSLYRKLGYSDLIEYPSAYRKTEKGKQKLNREKTRKLDIDKILSIYDDFTKDKTGFVIRDKTLMKAVAKGERIKPRQCIVSENGYLIFREDKLGVEIRELVALNAKEMDRLVSVAEHMGRESVYDRAVINSNLFDTYTSRGYMVLKRSFGVLMVKPLSKDRSFNEAYGDKFHISRLDMF